MLDSRSILVTMLALMVTGLVVYIVNWRLHRNMRGPGWWVVGFVIHGIGIVMMAMRGYIPASMVVVYSVFLVSGYGIFLYGLTLYNERPFNIRVLASCLIAMIIGIVYFSEIESSPIGRSIVHGAVQVFVLTLILNELRYVARKDGVGAVFVLALSIALIIPSNVLPLAMLYFMQPGIQSPVAPSTILPVAFLIVTVLQSMSIFGVVLMTAGRSQRELRNLAMTDVLTGLPNRRAFSTEVERVLEEIRQTGTQLGLSIIDVDHFKNVNDNFGHDVGDRVLLHIAQTIKLAMRQADFVARIGGEEFAVIMRVRDEAELTRVIERIRQCVEECPAEAGQGELKCTVSIGAAIVASDIMDYDALYNKADMALYKAKSEGRNQSVLAA